MNEGCHETWNCSQQDISILYFLSYQGMFAQAKVMKHSLGRDEVLNSDMTIFLEVFCPALSVKEAKSDKFPV